MAIDEPTGIQAFLNELKRRRVVRVALIYGAAAYGGLEAADLVLPALSAAPWVMTLLVVTAFVGFPIALVLSWLFDLTPQGIRRTSAASDGPEAAWLSAGSLVVLGGIVVAVGVGWWLTAVSGSLGSASSEGLRRVAVLPFENVGDSEQDAYFADGLGDELRTLLSRIGGLDVAARASSFRVRADADTPAVVADRLGVQAVLRGTVRKDRDRIRVRAELVSADAGAQLWNADYERLVDDVFAVQREIAGSIVEALGARLPAGSELSSDDVPETNPMAYDKYLWGRFNVNRRTAAGARDAIDNFNMSIALDSMFAAAWTGLAEAWARDLELGAAPDPGAAVDAGLAAARTAVRLDPASVEARSVLGLFLSRSFDWAAAEAELLTALEMDSSASDALLRYAEVLTATGRTEEAVAHIQTAIRVDGLSVEVRRAATRILAATGRVQEAIAEGQATLELAANDAGAWADMGFVFLAAGRFDDAVNAFQRLAELTSADAEAARELVERARLFLTTGSRDQVPMGAEPLFAGRPGTEALFHACVGDLERAIAALSTAVADRAYDLPTLVGLPTLDPVRADPAFMGLARSMGGVG